MTQRGNSPSVAQSPRILVTGCNGQVGWSLVRRLADVGDVFAPWRQQMDMASPKSIRDAVRSFNPRWIVNAAAYTAVDKAESEPEAAYAVNRDAVAVLAEEARALNACMIHYSTDYVFDGASTTPYVETDATSPLGIYGASKLAGEQILATSGAPHLIFRTSWVYGARGKNFLLTILKLASERAELRIVADQHGAPTWCGDLASITAEAIRDTERRAQEAGCAAAEALEQRSGVYHACNSGETTWHGFAAEALRQMQARKPESRFAALIPITTAEYPTPARRPRYSLLNCGKLESGLGLRMDEWKSSLSSVLASLPQV